MSDREVVVEYAKDVTDPITGVTTYKGAEYAMTAKDAESLGNAVKVVRVARAEGGGYEAPPKGKAATAAEPDDGKT